MSFGGLFVVFLKSFASFPLLSFLVVEIGASSRKSNMSFLLIVTLFFLELQKTNCFPFELRKLLKYLKPYRGCRFFATFLSMRAYFSMSVCKSDVIGRTD